MKLTDDIVLEYLETREMLLDRYAKARSLYLSVKEDLEIYNIFLTDILGIREKDMIKFGSDKFKLKYSAKELDV